MRKKINCKKIDPLLGLYIYEELNDNDKRIVETHLASCAACSMKVANFKKATTFLFKEKEEPKPLPDWDRSWQVIRNRMESQTPPVQVRKNVITPIFKPNFQLKWAGALAAAAVIFIIGFFTGNHLQDRSFLSETSQTAHNNQNTINSSEIARVEKDQREYFVQELQEHIEDLKPVILEYANYWNTSGGQEAMGIEKEMVVNLLIRNQLLLCRLPSDNNRYMQQLLNELKVILTKIAALTLDDKESLTSIKKMIRQKGLLFKMEAVRPVSNGRKNRISL